MQGDVVRLWQQDRCFQGLPGLADIQPVLDTAEKQSEAPQEAGPLRHVSPIDIAHHGY